MQIYFDVAGNAAAIGAEPKDEQTDAERGTGPDVAANDNECWWPLIPFPDTWYASP
jgi:hypothetical protein